MPDSRVAVSFILDVSDREHVSSAIDVYKIKQTVNLSQTDLRSVSQQKKQNSLFTMAVVPSNSEPVDALDGVELLYQSAQFFDQALKQFRICHDLCIASDILEKPAVASMDQCAVKFRQISSYCATLSEKVGSVWCGTCGTFYRNLEKIQDKNPAKLLEKISKNGSELAEGFCHLADCSQKLSRKFFTMQVGGATIGDKYVQAFKEEQKKVQALQQTTQSKLANTRMQNAQLEMEYEHKQRSFYERGKRLFRRDEYELAQAEFTVRSAKEQEVSLQEEVKQLEKKLAEQATQTKKAEASHI